MNRIIITAGDQMKLEKQAQLIVKLRDKLREKDDKIREKDKIIEKLEGKKI